MRATLLTQAELLRALQSQQAAYKSTFGLTDWRRACEVRFDGREQGHPPLSYVCSRVSCHNQHVVL